MKVGTDGEAADIDLSPVASTVGALNALPEPDDLPDDDCIEPQEKKMRVVDGTLLAFKSEPDCDYHLVLEDTAGVTMIGEIPAPKCAPGSPLKEAIKKARSAFETKFPGGAKKWKYPKIPIRVTGVAFFDRKHGQKGLASNGIELHPVLDIVFNPTSLLPVSPPSPGPGGAALSIIEDGGFEAAPSPWSVDSNQVGASYIAKPGPHSHTGSGYAYLGGKNNVEATLSQTVTLPSGASTAHLVFSLDIDTKEASDGEAYDQLSVEVRDTQTNKLVRKRRFFSNADASKWGNQKGVYFPFKLKIVHNQDKTVQIIFRATTDESFATSFRIDDVAVVIAP